MAKKKKSKNQIKKSMHVAQKKRILAQLNRERMTTATVRELFPKKSKSSVNWLSYKLSQFRRGKSKETPQMKDFWVRYGKRQDFDVIVYTSECADISQTPEVLFQHTLYLITTRGKNIKNLEDYCYRKHEGMPYDDYHEWREHIRIATFKAGKSKDTHLVRFGETKLDEWTTSWYQAYKEDF